VSSAVVLRAADRSLRSRVRNRVRCHFLKNCLTW
jgi:hypothetical protein